MNNWTKPTLFRQTIPPVKSIDATTWGSKFSPLSVTRTGGYGFGVCANNVIPAWSVIEMAFEVGAYVGQPLGAGVLAPEIRKDPKMKNGGKSYGEYAEHKQAAYLKSRRFMERCYSWGECTASTTNREVCVAAGEWLPADWEHMPLMFLVNEGSHGKQINAIVVEITEDESSPDCLVMYATRDLEPGEQVSFP